MPSAKLRRLAAVSLAAVLASSPALARIPEGFREPEKAHCRLCEPSAKLRSEIEVPIPERAIVLDHGNGVFWKGDQLTIVDLDRAEVLTYRFPRGQDRPTKLQLVSENALSPERLADLLRKAKAIWDPPVPKTFPLRINDLFETLYVVDGPTMASWITGSSDPAWYSGLLAAVQNSAAP